MKKIEQSGKLKTPQGDGESIIAVAKAAGDKAIIEVLRRAGAKD